MSGICSKHNHFKCVEYANNIITKVNNNTLQSNDYINFIEFLRAYQTVNCLTPINQHYNIIVNGLIAGSKKYIINPHHFSFLIQMGNEQMVVEIMQNCIELKDLWIDIMINQNIGNFNILIYIIEKQLNTIKNIIFENITLNGFNMICKNIYGKYYPYSNSDNFIIEYFRKNKELMSDGYILNILNIIQYRVVLIKEIYQIILPQMGDSNVKSILDKIVPTLNHEIILTILETHNEVKPDLVTIKALVSKSYCAETNGAYNKKEVATIMDIFIQYGFIVTKEILLILVDHGCCINNIETCEIEIDDDIMLKCIERNYYPIYYNGIPSDKCIIAECSKINNVENIKKLKDKGVKFKTEHLAKACSVRKNGKVIKFLINECNVIPDDSCILNIEQLYSIDGLDLLIKNYKKQVESQHNNNENSFLKLNDECVIKLDSINKELNENDEYLLKAKIRKLLHYKSKKIQFNKLKELILKYFIDNELVIGNYLVMNNNLSSITKLPNNTIMHINQLHTICSYMIDDEI